MAIQESDNRALWLIANSLEHIAYALDRICPPAQSAEDNTELCGEDVGVQEPVERDLEKTRSTGEPLIKDEKIRKTVRAWAEEIGVSEVMAAHLAFNTTTLASISDASKQISFSNERAFLPRSKKYTIAELCGEEEG